MESVDACEEEAFQAKFNHVMEILAPWLTPGAAEKPEVFRAAATHYRLRTKFAVAEFPVQAAGEGGAEEQGGSSTGPTELGYFEPDGDKMAVRVTHCPIATIGINTLMPQVLAAVNASPALRDGLKAVSFLDTLAGDRLVSLIYGQEMHPHWEQEARARLRDPLDIQVLGRSRGVCKAVDRDFVKEQLHVDGRVLCYKQVEGSFSNPNGFIAVSTLQWLCSVCRTITQAWDADRDGPIDLLELYCGNGNHTVALAPFFRRVVGVEINARLVACANENLRANLPPPLTACVIKIPAEAFSPGMLQRPYLMAQGPWGDAAFHFRVILVDPPRAGLDKHTLRVCRRFEHVVYISCCPPSLARDLGGEQGLGSTHEVVRLAILDHFPNTKHIECAVYLRRRAQTHAPEDGQAK